MICYHQFILVKFYNFFLNKMKLFDFKFSSKLFQILTPLNSFFVCPALLNTQGKKKLSELGF